MHYYIIIIMLIFGKERIKVYFVMVTTGLSDENYFRYILDLLHLYGNGNKVCDRKKEVCRYGNFHSNGYFTISTLLQFRQYYIRIRRD